MIYQIKQWSKDFKLNNDQVISNQTTIYQIKNDTSMIYQIKHNEQKILNQTMIYKSLACCLYM